MKIVFATNNPNKLREAQQLIGEEIEILSLASIGCTEDIPETQPTIEGNASQKSFYVYEKYGANCFADDTGLEIEALNGEPGVYSARYAGEGVAFEKNMEKVLMKMDGQENRNSQFKTVVSLVIDGKEVQFPGIVKGDILQTASGVSGFGYDPIFKPTGFDETFAEMSSEQKNKISHRGIAMRKLAEYFKTIK